MIFYFERNVHWVQENLSFQKYFSNDAILKEHLKIVKIYMVKVNVTILNRPKIMKFS